MKACLDSSLFQKETLLLFSYCFYFKPSQEIHLPIMQTFVFLLLSHALHILLGFQVRHTGRWGMAKWGCGLL